MQANYVQRLRLTFSKEGPARFIGHLDLARTLERSFVRVRVPIAYSQGFSPRPRLALASALPLGFTSEHELADIWLTETVEPATVAQQMMGKMAPGITVHNVQDVALSAPSLQSITSAAEYRVEILDEAPGLELPARVDRLLAAGQVVREQRRRHGKGRTYDLRPLILNLRLENVTVGPATIFMKLTLKEGMSGRPDEVLDALGIDPLAARVHRTVILLDG